jgi:AcrR family transcriptional regulator
VADEASADSAIARRRASAREAASDTYSQRRAEIVATAAGLFHKQGYQATSLADVAEAVGTDRATLYYYVGSKEELLDAVVSDVVRANLAAAETIRDSDEAAPVKLRRLVVDIMDQYARNYPFLYVYVQENLAHVTGKREAWAQEMRAINRRYEDAVTAIIADGIADGSLRAVGEPRVLAYGLLGMVSWSSRWFNPQRSGPDATTIGETYAELLLSGMVTDRS